MSPMLHCFLFVLSILASYTHIYIFNLHLSIFSSHSVLFSSFLTSVFPHSTTLCLLADWLIPDVCFLISLRFSLAWAPLHLVQIQQLLCNLMNAVILFSILFIFFLLYSLQRQFSKASSFNVFFTLNNYLHSTCNQGEILDWNHLRLKH